MTRCPCGCDRADGRLRCMKAAAAYLGITERHLRQLRYDRKIPATKIGGALRFDKKQLDRYIDRRTEAA